MSSDLRGKKIALAQSSPSHYFALNMLVSGGVQPSEVEMGSLHPPRLKRPRLSIATRTSRPPSPGRLTSTTWRKFKGNHMLVTTATANKLIADVWFARADFAQDHPEIVEGLVRGIFDAMVELKDDAAKQTGSQTDGRWVRIAGRGSCWQCSRTPTARTGPRTISSS